MSQEKDPLTQAEQMRLSKLQEFKICLDRLVQESEALRVSEARTELVTAAQSDEGLKTIYDKYCLTELLQAVSETRGALEFEIGLLIERLNND